MKVIDKLLDRLADKIVERIEKKKAMIDADEINENFRSIKIDEDKWRRILKGQRA